MASKKLLRYVLLYTVGVALLTMPLAIPVLKSSADFSVFNTRWNGIFHFAKMIKDIGYKVKPLMAPYAEIGDGSVFLIIGPRKDFTTEEVEFLGRLLENGGKLLIADDFGTGNQVLLGLGLDARFSGMPLRDMSFSKAPFFPLIMKGKSHEMVKGIKATVLNHPTALLNVKSGEGLLYSSELSWIESKENYRMDEGEKQGPFPILALIPYGNGEIILLSDPSALINEMLEIGDNRQLAQNIITYLSDGGKNRVFYIDEAHLASPNPYETATIVIRRDLTPEVGLTALVLVLLAAFIIEAGIIKSLASRARRLTTRIHKRLFMPGGEVSYTEEEIIEEILRRNPDWSNRLLVKLLREIKTGSKLGIKR